ncbi:MAG: hypothetical protein M0Q99_10975 [Candidatus Cloacimonetes bacterium]|nr:hypothetical protein [Candidatus Cloacimonadota bacterium]
MFGFDDFKGNTPIADLRYNIEEKYNHFFPNGEAYLKGLYKKNKKENPINFHIDDEPIISPYAKNERINIQENFLAFLWCICFYMLWYYENTQIKVDYLANSDAREMQNLESHATQLFEWAMSLKTKFSSWNLRLPNPTPEKEPLSPMAVKLSLKTNDLFSRVTAIILFHELGHIYGEHSPLTNDEFIQCEIDADNFSNECVFNNQNKSLSEAQKSINILALLLSRGYMFFAIPRLNALQQNRHPNLVVRYFHLTNWFCVSDKEKWLTTVQCFAVLICERFCTYHKICLNPPSNSAQKMLTWYETELNHIMDLHE